MTEQEKIEQAATNHAQTFQKHGSQDHAASFKAGASYYQKECMPGMMVGFAEWVDDNSLYQRYDGKWLHRGTQHTVFALTTNELLEKFFEHLKHNQDAGSENK